MGNRIVRNRVANAHLSEIHGFVVLHNGTRKEYPTATEIRGSAGIIDVWNEHIYLEGFKKEDVRDFWLDPRFYKPRFSSMRRTR